MRNVFSAVKTCSNLMVPPKGRRYRFPSATVRRLSQSGCLAFFAYRLDDLHRTKQSRRLHPRVGFIESRDGERILGGCVRLTVTDHTIHPRVDDGNAHFVIARFKQASYFKPIRDLPSYACGLAVHRHLREVADIPEIKP